MCSSDTQLVAFTSSSNSDRLLQFCAGNIFPFKDKNSCYELSNVDLTRSICKRFGPIFLLINLINKSVSKQSSDCKFQFMNQLTENCNSRTCDAVEK